MRLEYKSPLFTSPNNGKDNLFYLKFANVDGIKNRFDTEKGHDRLDKTSINPRLKR